MHGASPPKLMLMTRAGFGLTGAPATLSPAAQRMPSTMSATSAPHLPATRTGSTRPSRLTPATPSALSVSAATMPAMSVPCHELFATSQFANSGFESFSAWVTQSPGSLGSASRPSPSLANSTVETKSWPDSTCKSRTGCAVMPVSSTAITAAGPPNSIAHADCTPGTPRKRSFSAFALLPLTGCSHHWPVEFGALG